MSRCGSCPLCVYDEREEIVAKYGVSCDGDCGCEECAETLQAALSFLEDINTKLKNPH